MREGFFVYCWLSWKLSYTFTTLPHPGESAGLGKEWPKGCLVHWRNLSPIPRRLTAALALGHTIVVVSSRLHSYPLRLLATPRDSSIILTLGTRTLEWTQSGRNYGNLRVEFLPLLLEWSSHREELGSEPPEWTLSRVKGY